MFKIYRKIVKHSIFFFDNLKNIFYRRTKKFSWKPPDMFWKISQICPNFDRQFKFYCSRRYTSFTMYSYYIFAWFRICKKKKWKKLWKYQNFVLTPPLSYEISQFSKTETYFSAVVKSTNVASGEEISLLYELLTN